MTVFKITMISKLDYSLNINNTTNIYVDANNEKEAEQFFDNNFSRFNKLVKITVSHKY